MCSSDLLRRCTVVLDTSRTGYDEVSFDRAVSVAASVVTASERAGLTTRLASPATDVRGHEVATSVLHWLAVVEPGDDTLDPRQVSGSDDGLGLVVLVCATTEAARRLLGASRIAPDDTVVVVHTAPADDGSTTTGMPAGYTIAAPDLASFAAAWQGLTDGAP